MKKQKSKAKSEEKVITVDTTNGNLNGIPPIQFLVAMQGLEALDRGMMLTRTATAQRCMEIISQVTGQTYKRTDRHKALQDAYMIDHAYRESKRRLAEDRRLRN